MLDGKAYKAHFPDDPAYDVASRVEAPRMPNSAELLAALAALEHGSDALYPALSGEWEVPVTRNAKISRGHRLTKFDDVTA